MGELLVPNSIRAVNITLGHAATTTHLPTVLLTLRIDLDYVPWDAPDAEAFGHGEPAMILRLLDFARTTGLKLHFFISARSLRAFPATVDAILGEAHDLDWLAKHAEDPERYKESATLFGLAGHKPIGIALKTPWSADLKPEWVSGFQFLSAPPGPCPQPLTHFSLGTRPLVEAIRAGVSMRSWTDEIKCAVARAEEQTTIVVRPQVLSKTDPQLKQLKEIVDFATANSIAIRTMRDLVKGH